MIKLTLDIAAQAIQRVEEFYKQIHEAEGRRIRLPKSYPTNVIRELLSSY